jgi:hypothetical protein
MLLLTNVEYVDTLLRYTGAPDSGERWWPEIFDLTPIIINSLQQYNTCVIMNLEILGVWLQLKSWGFKNIYYVINRNNNYK